MGELTGKTAVVTGASSGIGRGIALELARAGAVVVIAARRADRLDTLVAEVAEFGGRAVPVPTDVTDEAQVDRLFETCLAEAGTPDILVNNAGIADDKATEDLTLDRWREVIDSNLTSAFLCARAAIRLMKPAGGGRIINIGSLSAHSPRAHSPAYTASKFAIDGFTRSIALDGRDHGILASCLHPGATRSELAPGKTDRLEKDCLFPEDLGRIVVLMATLPDGISMSDATVLPVKIPFLGRG